MVIDDFPLLSPYLSSVIRESFVSLYIYDVSNRASFEFLSEFHDSLPLDILTLPSSMDGQCKKKPIVVVANKIDLSATRVVAQSEGQEFAARIGAKYIETSAKDNVGIKEAIFTVLVEGLIYYAELKLPNLRKEAAERGG